MEENKLSISEKIISEINNNDLYSLKKKVRVKLLYIRLYLKKL